MASPIHPFELATSSLSIAFRYGLGSISKNSGLCPPKPNCPPSILLKDLKLSVGIAGSRTTRAVNRGVHREHRGIFRRILNSLCNTVSSVVKRLAGFPFGDQ